ncbi:MAG TPA: hypothetical protein DD670_21260, partial [Planctomycetaceae bacterium]|nr:hypothetical protein [Planctomycetaceae bacterium]
LEDRLFLRAVAGGADPSVECFFDRDGVEVAPEIIESLGMRNTVELDRSPERAEETVARLARLVEQRLSQRFAGSGSRPTLELAAVWCKHAEGKIRVTIGEHSVDLAFAGWARVLEPPAVPGPDSDQTSYHLAALDDGRIVAAERVAVCQQSGCRVLIGELATCSATGRQVLPEFIESCPVSGAAVLRTEMGSCSVCCQRVAPAVLHGCVCAACGGMEPVNKADPRLARLLDTHPSLERWRHWRIAESATAYHLTARGWLRKLLLLVDKDSLELKLLATGRRFRVGWDEVEPSCREFFLRG